jgi:hypothetical protein
MDMQKELNKTPTIIWLVLESTVEDVLMNVSFRRWKGLSR